MFIACRFSYPCLVFVTYLHRFNLCPFYSHKSSPTTIPSSILNPVANIPWTIGGKTLFLYFDLIVVDLQTEVILPSELLSILFLLPPDSQPWPCVLVLGAGLGPQLMSLMHVCMVVYAVGPLFLGSRGPCNTLRSVQRCGFSR